MDNKLLLSVEDDVKKLKTGGNRVMFQEMNVNELYELDGGGLIYDVAYAVGNFFGKLFKKAQSEDAFPYIDPEKYGVMY